MVKKLFKYEILHYMNALAPFELLIPVVALLTRIVQFFETNTTPYDIVFASSIFIYIIALIAGIVMTVVTVITRFYKNLFTAEGYLTMTLPASENQHLLTKLTTAVLATLTTLVNILISIAIVTSGEVLCEILKSIGYLWKRCMESTGAAFIVIVVEAIILFLLALCCTYLLYYTCITLGQTARKNRILAAFGVYFGYYVVCQILGTIAIAIISLYPDNALQLALGVLDSMSEAQGLIFIFLIGIVVYLLLGVVYYFISRTILRKKLNLE